MSVRGLVTVVIGVVAFVVIDSLITNIRVKVSQLSNQLVNWWLTRGNLSAHVTSLDNMLSYETF
jgi:hypothetical protein